MATTTTTTITRFNANYARPVIIDAYKKGNKSLIKEKDFAELNVPQLFFKWYINDMLDLYDACLAVARMQHNFSVELDNAELKKLTNKAFAVWKKMLECAEPEKDSHVIRCNPADVNDLISFTWRFVKDANNVSESKEFVVKQTYGDDSKNNFRKKVETMLGLMAVGAQQMDGYKVRYLKEESKILGKIRKNRKNKEEAENTLAALRGDLASATEPQITKYLETRIASVENEVKIFTENLKKLSETLADFHANPDKYVDKVDLMKGQDKPEEPAPAEIAPAETSAQ